MNHLKVWVEINASAIRKNVATFRNLLRPRTKLWAVVKSNAYGHGLLVFSKTVEKMDVDGFCVDSAVEGLKLRQSGIEKSILVLGPVMNHFFSEAAKQHIAVTISTAYGLKELLRAREKPAFHLKIDTGMHRQGFYLRDLPSLASLIKKKHLPLQGVYTHFASAKDLNYPTFTDFQFHAFKKAVRILREHGFPNLIRHAAATGGTMISQEYHLDAVRIGIGLYGLWPSRELEWQLKNNVRLVPALTWRSRVSEVKTLRAGDYVGYDLVERTAKKTLMAIVPIGYWHGFDRGLSSIGEVLIRGKRARVLGRVSMDLLTVDATGIPCKIGDRVTLIGTDNGQTITAGEVASKIGTTHYELVTRINPLTERVLF